MGNRKKSSTLQTDPSKTKPFDILNSFLKSGVSKISENKIVIIIFILCFIIYNTYTTIRMSGDTIPAAYLPFSIIYYHDLFFEQFCAQNFNAYFFTNVNGHLMSIFPIVTPILITPFVFLCSFGMSPDQVSLFVAQIARTTSAGIAALAVCIFYLVVIRLVPEKIAILSSLIFAFATSTWSTSSQALWQHGMIELLLLLMIYIIVKNEDAFSRRSFIYLGLLSGVFVFCRPPDAILLIPILGYVFFRNFKYSIYYIAPAILSGLPFLAYNLYFFGNILGGYVQNFQKFDLSLDVLFNYLGLFISPNKGILIFSPILILAIFGYFSLKSINNKNVSLLLHWFGPILILDTLVYSFFGDWGGGYSYGPRYLTALVPVLSIYVALSLSDFWAHFHVSAYNYLKTGVIASLLIFSVAIQFIGVFYFPYLYDANYSQPWDLSKPVIINSMQDGKAQIDTFVIQSIPPLPPLFYYSRSDSQTFQYAKVAREAGDYPTAAGYYEKYLQTNPNSSIGWNELGSCQMKLGQYEDALQSYDRSLAISPDNENMWTNKAIALQSLHRFNEARDAYDTALRLKLNKTTNS